MNLHKWSVPTTHGDIIVSTWPSATCRTQSAESENAVFIKCPHFWYQKNCGHFSPHQSWSSTVFTYLPCISAQLSFSVWKIWFMQLLEGFSNLVYDSILCIKYVKPGLHASKVALLLLFLGEGFHTPLVWRIQLIHVESFSEYFCFVIVVLFFSQRRGSLNDVLI